MKKPCYYNTHIYVYCDSDTPTMLKNYSPYLLYFSTLHILNEKSIFSKPVTKGEKKCILATEGENKFILATSSKCLKWNPRDLFNLLFKQDSNTFWTSIPCKENEFRIIISTNKIVSLALLARAHIPRKNETEINSYPIPLLKYHTHLIQIIV
jgi:hypothetical protein